MSTTHPEPAEIAALDADLLTPDEGAALRDHLAACAACAAVLADLQTLSSELHAVPSPPLPEDVAARIDAALMAEAAASATVSRETRPLRRARWPRMVLAAAAALVAVGLGGALLQTIDLDSDASEDSASTIGEAALDSGEDAAGGQSASDPLAAQVRALLAEDDESQTLDTEGEDPSTTEPDNTTHGFDVPSCVWETIDRAEEPLAVGEDTFEGQNSYVVVYPDPADSARVDAYAVAADCVSRSPANAGEILAQGNYPLSS